MGVLNNKEFKNASWLIGGKIGQMIISFALGIITARYLGPSNYGLINYAAAYVAFFTSICTLGINSIIIKEFVDNPNDQGKAIGTTLVLRGISSLLSSILIVCAVCFIDRGEVTTIYVVALCSIALVFQIFDTINYWFQAQHKSKVTSIVMLLAYLMFSAYKIVLLVMKVNILWFALASSVDYIFIALFLFLAYKQHKGPKLSFTLLKAKELLNSSKHYLISGILIAIYMQVDKLILKQMLNEAEVGFYSMASTLSNLWVFVLAAIIDAMFPVILKLYKENKEEFNRKNRQLYAIVFYLSLFVSILFTVFGRYPIEILYGAAYIPSIKPLRLITWSTAFTYLGSARNAWIISENKQKYLKFMYIGAVIINVILNLTLIPILGTTGAALASLFTQISTSILIPLFFKEMRPNVILMFEALTFKKLTKK